MMMVRLTARMDDGTSYVCSETGNEGVGYFTTQRRLTELIAKLATYEDAEEQGRLVLMVYGRWIKDAEPDTDNNIQCHCSRCFAGDLHAKDTPVPYCWSCGARMNGKESV